MIGDLLESSARGGELERPQEVGRLLEVWPDSEDLVDEVLDANDALLACVCTKQSKVFTALKEAKRWGA